MPVGARRAMGRNAAANNSRVINSKSPSSQNVKSKPIIRSKSLLGRTSNCTKSMQQESTASQQRPRLAVNKLQNCIGPTNFQSIAGQNINSRQIVRQELSKSCSQLASSNLRQINSNDKATGGFATQIPILISQSHTAAASTTKTISKSSAILGANETNNLQQITRTNGQRRLFNSNQLHCATGSLSKLQKHIQNHQTQTGFKSSLEGAKSCSDLLQLSSSEVLFEPEHVLGNSIESSKSAHHLLEITTNVANDDDDKNKPCEACLRLTSQVKQLESEKKVLQEQLSELEEMENDSRLISQKLGKKLTQAEQQLETCGCELKRAVESESSYQFQNKRLNFELCERADRIKELQVQLNRVQQKLARAEEVARRDARSSELAMEKLESQLEEANEKMNHVESKHEQQQITRSIDDNANVDHNHGSCMNERDSAYSKSSSSSDAQSDDGRDSDEPSTLSDNNNNKSDLIKCNKNIDCASEKSSDKGQLKSCNEATMHLAAMPAQTTTTPTSTESSSGDESLDQVKRVEKSRQIVQQHSRRKPANQENCLPTEKQQKKRLSEAPANNPIELALEGVERLERACCSENSDVDLRSLVEPHKSLNIRADDSWKSKASAKSDQVAACHSSQILNSLKQEVAQLKSRLFQSQMLNDNLVSELRNKFQHQSSPIVARNHQQHQQQYRHSIAIASANNTTNLRSFVYINHNSSSEGANNNIGHCNDTVQSSNENSAQLLQEYVEFLRDLLSKLHCHHGQTFDLLKESEKVAMCALKSSHSYELNSLHHHRSVVASGWAAINSNKNNNQSINIANDQSVINYGSDNDQSMHLSNRQLLASQHQASYPILPPPRRRNGASGGIGPTQPIQAPLQAQLEAQATRKPSMSQAALQVAKQTLFSVVPIHFNSSADQQPHQQQQYATLRNANANFSNAKTTNSFGAQLLRFASGSRSSSSSGGGVKLTSKYAYPNNNSLTQQPYANQTTNPNENNNNKSTSSFKWASNNVSVLEINQRQQEEQIIERENISENNTRLCYLNQQGQQKHSDEQELQQPLQQNPMAADFSQVYQVSVDQHNQLRQQHQIGPDSASSISFKEQIERYQAHFNALLLDLLNRQNWFEQLIAGKLRVYQQKCNNNVNGDTHNQQQALKLHQYHNQQCSTPTELPIHSMLIDHNDHQHQQLSQRKEPTTNILVHANHVANDTNHLFNQQPPMVLGSGKGKSMTTIISIPGQQDYHLQRGPLNNSQLNHYQSPHIGSHMQNFNTSQVPNPRSKLSIPSETKQQQQSSQYIVSSNMNGLY